LDFLTELYEQGQQYSSLNTARSALSSVIVLSGDVPAGKHPLVCRFLKGVFQERPALPRYVDTWDVSLVLNYLKAQYPLQELGLKELTLKLAMLMALLSGQRSQTLQQLCTTDIIMTDTGCTIHIAAPLKHTRPGTHQAPIRLPKYNDSSLCVVDTLRCYLERTLEKRVSETQLFISFCKPHKRVASDTVSRWIKSVMKAAGIDTTRYKPHSTRSASTSAAARVGVTIDNILSCAGWSNCETFARFYNKPLSEYPEHAFARSILAAAT
jgi:integrase